MAQERINRIMKHIRKWDCRREETTFVSIPKKNALNQTESQLGDKSPLRSNSWTIMSADCSAVSSPP